MKKSLDVSLMSRDWLLLVASLVPLAPVQRLVYIAILRKELPHLLQRAGGSIAGASSLHNIVSCHGPTKYSVWIPGGVCCFLQIQTSISIGVVYCRLKAIRSLSK